MAVSATIHCLTGCAIGEVLGMVIGTALGWGSGQTIPIAVVLAFVFGYGLTMLPLVRSGLAVAAAAKLALAADTASISIMEIVDNAIMPVIAGAAAFPVNRWSIARGRGHAVVHQHHGAHQ